jgi:prolyl oligopeptidase
MRLLYPAILLALIACNRTESDTTTVFKTISVTYPPTLRDTTRVDTLYGKRIRDPFRWLENGNSPATRDWMIQQQTLTERYLNQIPYRAPIRQRLEQLWNFAYVSNPIRKGNFYYVLQQERLQPQPVLYRMRTLQDTTRQMVLNLNSLGVSGAQLLEHFALSQDGSLLAYEVSESGARWNTIFIKDMGSNRPLLDTLEGVRFSNIAWYRDGFFYSRYPQERQLPPNAPYEFQQVYYHRVGSPQADDELIFADRSNPRINFTAQTTSDERFMILYAQQHSNGNALYFRNLQSETLDFTPIIESYDAVFKVVDHVNDNLLIYTNYKAPNYRLVQINTQRPEERFWENTIPEAAEVLQDVQLYGGKLVTTYIKNGASVLKIFDVRGRLQREIAAPAEGRITAWSGNVQDARLFFTLQSFYQPPAVYTLNMNDFNFNIYKTSVNKTDTTRYETRQIRYKSYDGTEVSLTIVAKAGLKPEDARLTLLLTEAMDFPIAQAVLEHNGICAIAHVRGSSGWGDTWAQAGRKGKKQSALDDFQAAAEYLIANHYTNPAKLAVYGRGNGGLVVGASITQRPDLFQVALLDAAVLDMLRYQAHTVGWNWMDEYGTIEKPDEFDALVAYSPLHNVVPANYPATLLLTTNRNNAVVPAHSYKFAAELQQHQRGAEPILLRIAQGGERQLLPEQVSQATDLLAFLFYHVQEQW